MNLENKEEKFKPQKKPKDTEGAAFGCSKLLRSNVVQKFVRYNFFWLGPIALGKEAVCKFLKAI